MSGVKATLFAWNDLLWTLLACFMVMVAVLVTQVQQKKTADGEEKPAGSASVYVFWPDGMAADIDTHAKLPSGEHVFFRHQQGKTANLLRDDLGMNADTGIRNFENLFFRELVPGEYVINIHAFMATKDSFPIPVDVELNFLGDPPVRFAYKITFLQEGEEVTAFRFLIGADGKLVPGSVSSLQTPFIFGEK